MPLPAPLPREKLHTRTITCEGFRRHDGLWDVEAHIVDVKSFNLQIRQRGTIPAGEHLHEMWLRLTIDDDYVIQDIVASTEASPWEYCQGAAANFARLKGIALTSGFMSEVSKRLSRAEACTHIFELLRPLATVAHQTIRNAPKPDGTPQGGANPAMLDSCYAFASDGPIAKALWPEHTKEPEHAPAEVKP
ncbi:MAG TPA: DUF2889 domain-containing protein [Stellaceae bacterium]|nr:DUF2889 domain-containing protein [Stellaceae bacterium]